MRLRRRPDPAANDQILPAALWPEAWAMAEELKARTGAQFDLYLRRGVGPCAWAVRNQRPARVVLGEGLTWRSSRELYWTIAHEVGHLLQPRSGLRRKLIVYPWLSLPGWPLVAFLLLSSKLIGPLAYFLSLLGMVSAVLALPALAFWLIRREERRADAWAYRLVGYGPELDFFGEGGLMRLASTRPRLRPLLRLFLTHPYNDERVAAAQAMGALEALKAKA